MKKNKCSCSVIQNIEKLIVNANPLHRDPTRTTALRKKYMKDMERRFKKVSKEIWEFVVTDDAFGLIPTKPLTFQAQVPKQAYRFLTDVNKVKAYRKWLLERMNANILTLDTITNKPWQALYAESAYRRGMTKAYLSVNKQELAADKIRYLGGKEQFLKDAFNQPVQLSKIEGLYIRAFDELTGVTQAMSQQMGRILADGFIKGQGPMEIARLLQKNVAGMTRQRAKVIARTETIRAHAEGQLDGFELLGVEEVGLLVEWSAAFNACPDCNEMAARSPFTIDEARGWIPLHPNCRCSWVPYVKGLHRRFKR